MIVVELESANGSKYSFFVTETTNLLINERGDKTAIRFNGIDLIDDIPYEEAVKVFTDAFNALKHQ